MEYEEREFSCLRCLISVPPGQPPERGWPVLVFLHGSKEAAPTELRAALTAHGPLSESSGSAATQRFAVIAPQLPAPGGDVWGSQAESVKAIAFRAVRDYQGDSTRIYLTGFSYGGNGVLNMGCRQRDVWAALWPVDPTMPPVEGTDQPIWVSAGPHSRVNNSTFRKVWGVQERAPEAPPSPNRVYEDRGLNHVCTAAAAYRDKTIYDWLLTHRQRR